MAEEEIPYRINQFSEQTTPLVFLVIGDLILGLTCALLNGIAMRYYQIKLQESINHVLYFTLSILGVIISVGALLHGIIIILTIYYTESALKVLVPIAYMMVMVGAYVTTMVNICLAVIRTIYIVSPLMTINQTKTLLSVGIYAFVWVVIGCLDIWTWYTIPLDGKPPNFGEAYQWTIINMAGFFGVINLYHNEYKLPKYLLRPEVFPFLIWGIPYVIPSIICITCCAIQIYSLWERRQFGHEGFNRRITITILMLTAVFAVCNTTTFIYCMLMVSLQWKGHGYRIGLYTTSIMILFINTLLNPVILILRGRQLRGYFKNFVLHRTSELRESVQMMTKNPGSIKNISKNRDV